MSDPVGDAIRASSAAPRAQVRLTLPSGGHAIVDVPVLTDADALALVMLITKLHQEGAHIGKRPRLLVPA